jgi:phage tail sheath protein FI
VAEYSRYFGGLTSYSLFPLYCQRALQAGSTLLISRVAHYTDLTDKSTVVGNKATTTVTVGADVITIVAASIGSWGNGLEISIVAAANGVADEVDITVVLASYPELGQTLTNVALTPTADQLEVINAKLRLVDLTAPTGSLPLTAAVSLAGGAEDYTGVVAADYVGNVSTYLGIHAFDGSKEPTKIAVPENYDSAVEQALLAYVKSRGDMLAVLRMPNNINGLEAVDFRNKTGAYAGGIVVDDWRAFYVYGDIKVIDPRTDTQRDINVVGDLLGIFSSRDNNDFPWLSAAGSRRGKITNNLGVVYNMGVAARQDEANSVVNMGINPVIDHDTFGPVFWGNRTTQRTSTLLKYLNVAELLIYISRGLKPLAQEELFEPNDVQTWKTIYRKVDAFMQTVQDNRGVYSFEYQGDQGVDDVSEAQFNTSETIAQGQYRFRLFVAPINALEYVGMEAIVTNAGVSFELIEGTAI